MSDVRKILIVFPVFQAMYPRPFNGFAEMLIAAGRQTGYRFGVLTIERMPLAAAMNQVGQRMRDEDWDACIMVDDDCFPPYDAIPRLLTRCFDEGHPFVAAAGIMRGYPFTTTAARVYPEGLSAMVDANGKIAQLSGHEWIDDLPEALIDVDFCGVPIAIIHRDCFLKTSKPWFGEVDVRGDRTTHDVFFCNKLKAAGIPVKVDGTIRCGHLVEAPIITFENRASARGELDKMAVG